MAQLHGSLKTLASCLVSGLLTAQGLWEPLTSSRSPCEAQNLGVDNPAKRSQMEEIPVLS